MADASCAILVFSKAPVPGTVKSRLIREIGEARVTALYKSLVEQTLTITQKSAVGATELWCWPTTAHPFLQECAARFQVHTFTQVGDDLGERMHHAFTRRLQQFGCVLMVGCDCPEIAQEDFRRAAKELQNGADVILGPAEDGGYYLIGLRAAHRELFSGIEWGSAQVLEVTRRIVAELGLECVELEERWDLDRPADLVRYEEMSGEKSEKR